MRRWPRPVFTIVCTIVALIALAWLGLGWYISRHQEGLKSLALSEMNGLFSGTVALSRMEVSMLDEFPNVSVSLHTVVVRDSLWNQHRRTLFEAERLAFSVNLLSVLRGMPKFQQVSIRNGRVNLFTDAQGYTNASALATDRQPRKAQGGLSFRNIRLEGVAFLMEDRVKAKRFNIVCDKLAIQSKSDGPQVQGVATVRASVRQMTFNTQKGSFLQGQSVAMRVQFLFDRDSQLLSIPAQSIQVGAERLQFSARVHVGLRPVTFSMQFQSPGLSFRTARSWLSASIAGKLSALDLKRPLAVRAAIDGRVKFRDTPHVVVVWNTADNVLKTPGGDIGHADFTGSFDNELKIGGGKTDLNAAIFLDSFKGVFHGIPFHANNVLISNLKAPLIEGRIRSRFPLTAVNQAAPSQTFQFEKGQAVMDIIYRAGLLESDTTIPQVHGYVDVTDASFIYLPRRLPVKSANVRLRMDGTTLRVDRGAFKLASSNLSFFGEAQNFLNFYYTAPERILLNWQVTSSNINLNELFFFLNRRTPASPPGNSRKPATRYAKNSQRLDVALEKSQMKLHARVDRFVYKRLTATGLRADLFFSGNDINLRETAFRVAGGSVAISGALANKPNRNDVQLDAALKEINVRQLFAATDNFGQQAITSKNLRGVLTSSMSLKGVLLTGGTVLPESLNGQLQFDLRAGALVRFKPFERIGDLVFRKRNMDSIYLKKLNGTFDVVGTMIYIRPMAIESSALNVFVEGKYGLASGTEIFMDVPLRNPNEDSVIVDKKARERRNLRGVVIHLKAVDGANGEVRILPVVRGKKGRGLLIK